MAGGWSDLAARLGFALLLPEQRRANNPKRCFNWFTAGDTRRDAGEALSIRQMVDRMVAGYALDPGRVYVEGLSAGGAMAVAVLAAYPELFAGGAIIGGVPYGAATSARQARPAMAGRLDRRPAGGWGDAVRAASPHRGPWPRVSIWHGDADPSVNPVNAERLAEQWIELHGLASKPTLEERDGAHLRRVWCGPDGEALVESHTIAGMAHGAPIRAGAGPDCCGVAGRPPSTSTSPLPTASSRSGAWRRSPMRPLPLPLLVGAEGPSVRKRTVASWTQCHQARCGGLAHLGPRAARRPAPDQR